MDRKLEKNILPTSLSISRGGGIKLTPDGVQTIFACATVPTTGVPITSHINGHIKCNKKTTALVIT